MYHFFRPIYEPHNTQAQQLVSDLADTLGIKLSGAIGAKHRVILSSYLYLLTWVTPERDEVIWLVGNDNKQSRYWAYYPMAGATTVKNVRNALVQHGHLMRVSIDDISTPVGWGKSMDELLDLMGIKQPLPSPAKFKVCGKLIDKGLLNTCEFVEAHKPPVLVSRYEEYEDKVQRRSERRSSPKMPIKEVKQRFGRTYSKAVQTVHQMQNYWREHPLEEPNNTKLPNNFYASATRIFHNEDMRSGGRWYGRWNDLEGWERLNLLIDGEPVSEIDLNASQITLFSSLRAMPMKIQGSWEDAYSSVTDQLDYDEAYELIRDKVKQVVVEIIGAGNPNKNKPSIDFKSPFDGSKASARQFIEIRDQALRIFPALKELNKKRRLDFSGFLSFHEAEIMSQTLFKLKQEGIVAYPIHDCWIVKRRDVDDAVATIRDAVNEYVTTYQKANKLSVSNISVALSIESKNIPKLRLSGSYCAKDS